jgi:protein SCO1/2
MALASQAAADPRTIPLVDQRGATFRLNDLAGEPTVVTFVASRCSDACPIANALFSKTNKQLQRDGLAAHLVTVTLDPGYDTPAVMSRVAKRYGVAPSAWRFASGRPSDVRSLMRSLGVDAQADARGIPDQHTTFVYVLDRKVLLQRTLLLSTDLTNEIEAAVRKR